MCEMITQVTDRELCEWIVDYDEPYYGSKSVGSDAGTGLRQLVWFGRICTTYKLLEIFNF